jgi:hypothetical protein
MKDKFNYIATSYNNVVGHGYGRSPKAVVPFWTGSSHKYRGFSNATGNDEFALAVGSKGARVEQLKQALVILGESIDEENFGDQTRTALVHLGYPPAVLDEPHFNEIILRAYAIGKKKITLTEPEMRALYMKEVSPERRAKVTFEVWLKRQNVKSKITAGGKQAFDVLFGWLQLRAKGVGSTGGLPSEQPTDTSTGWFTKTADGSIPVGYIAIGGAVVIGLGIWGVSAIVKRNQKVVYVQN